MGNKRIRKNMKDTTNSNAIDFDAIEREVGNNFWHTREMHQLSTLPLDSIENVKVVCQKAGRHSTLWKTAYAKWLELSTAEVTSAVDAASADKALGRIPSGGDMGNYELSVAALIKCVSFRNIFDDIKAVVDGNTDTGRMIGCYGLYPQAILDQLFPLAKTLVHFVYLYEHGGRRTYNGGPEDPNSTRSKALPKLVGEFLKSAKHMTITTAFKALNRLPYELQKGAFKDFLDSRKFGEKELKVFISSLRSGNEDELKNIAATELDTITLRKVEKAKGLKQLKALRDDVSELPQSSRRLQEKIDYRLTALVKPEKLKTFAKLKAAYQSSDDHRFREGCWEQMKKKTLDLITAEELYDLAPRDTNEEREAHDIWLKLCSNDEKAVEKVFKRTSSIEAYLKKLTFVTTFAEALDVWGCADGKERDVQSARGFEKVLECIRKPIEGFELLTTCFNEGYGKRDAQTKVVLRTLEITADKDDILRLARLVKNPTWEAQAAIVVKLAKFYPMSKSKTLSARVAVVV